VAAKAAVACTMTGSAEYFTASRDEEASYICRLMRTIVILRGEALAYVRASSRLQPALIIAALMSVYTVRAKAL